MKWKKRITAILTTILVGSTFMMSSTGFAASKVNPDGTYKGIKLYGKVKVVEHHADLKVKIVNAFPDLKVQVVDSFPDKLGKWKFVESFPDFTVQFVDSFPDITIQYVNAFPGRG